MKFKPTLKKLYQHIPFKKEIFSFIKFLKVPSKSIYQHLYFTGVFNVKINSEKRFKLQHFGFVEENEIFWEGIYNGWEKKSIALWIELSKNCNTIFDIGANTGVYALVAKTMNPDAEVYAFEPIPKVYKALVSNVENNNFNIKSYEIALSDRDGSANIFLPNGEDFVYSVTVNKNTNSHSNVYPIEIDIQKLSTFIELNNISKIDLMKIDVETHEVEVLQGMESYLKQYKPTIIIEILSEEIAEQLNELFKDMDYLYFNIDDIKNSVRKTDKITKSDHWNFLFCNRKTALELNLI